MADLSYAQLKAVWLSAAQGTQYDSNAWASLMAAIAEAESSGNPNALNPTDNGGTQTSWGLWQISDGTHAEVSPNWNNPAVNARLALGKLQGSGLSAWGTYDSGAYRAYLNGATTPDGAGISGGSAVDAAYLASAASGGDCIWRIGEGGIPGSSIIHDIPGVGGSGNVASFSLCLLTRGQARAVLGGLMFLSGTGIMLLGVTLLVAIPALAGVAGGAGRIVGVAGQAGQIGKARTVLQSAAAAA
jgi:Lysozyme like domain